MGQPSRTVLGYYARPGVMTSAGTHAGRLAGLPPGIAGAAGVTHGVLVHEHMTALYGFSLPPERRDTVHLRRAERLLERIAAADGRPLDEARPVTERTAANCRQFTVLALTMLRAQGTPARARCGFAAYFGGGFFEDHWVCELWDADRQRWVLADAQLDAVHRDQFGIGFDVLDVPRDQFLTAGEAWRRFRAGQADPARFGLSVIGESGDWWIAGNLMRDAAALCGLELLPWDCWGVMPRPGEPIDAGRLALFDRLAGLTADPDATLAPLRALLAEDDRVAVPALVRNALRGCLEPV
ncbi:MAG TPA: transglutaminase domain-containing protein [Streptosporangiaceae bacterium]